MQLASQVTHDLALTMGAAVSAALVVSGLLSIASNYEWRKK